ncbi:hypothetical protein BC332_07170 [Capsicum chinense]|nr:hypothetical protein BC332_07170 [Capsicum chinense]
MVSSSGKNLFPSENLQLKRAHKGHQDKVNIMCSQIAAYKNEIPVINIVVWHDGKMWRTSGHTQSFKILAAIASWKSFMAAYLIALDILNIVSFTWFIIHGLGGEMQQPLLMVMNMHSLPDVLTFIIRSEIDTIKTTFISRVMKRRYGIMDVFLPCDLLQDILTGREHLHCSGRLTHFKGAILHKILEEFLKDSNLFCGKASDKASGKQGRYMRRIFGVVTLLAPKTDDRKFVKGYCPVLFCSLQYDFIKNEFWKHNYPMADDILDRRMVKRGNEDVCQVLIKWTGIDVVQV